MISTILLREILLPNRQSEHGPAIAVSDVDGDGSDDVFITGSAGTAPVLYFGAKDGSFSKRNAGPWAEFSRSEFIGAVFFDADGDSDPDLYLAAGSTEFPEGSADYQDRFFRNRGDGTFTSEQNALPPFPVSTQYVVPMDADGMEIWICSWVGAMFPVHILLPREVHSS